MVAMILSIIARKIASLAIGTEETAMKDETTLCVQ